MNRAIDQEILTTQLLFPESDLERALLKTAEFRQGLDWGKPRFGHPEGKVLFHIREVLDNINRLKISPEVRERLRLVALSHDTFKYKEAEFQHPRSWDQNHAKLATNFMQHRINDERLLKLIEFHDEAYFIWRSLFLESYQARGKERLARFRKRFEGELQEYYLFFKCDTRTGDKNQAPLVWFESGINGIELVSL